MAVEVATASTWWALMIVCARLGWNDISTARWLWRVDPNSARGQACGWAFLASGVWKATAAAVMAVPLAVLMETIRANPRVHELLATSAGTLIVGATLSLGLSLVAIWRARRIRLRLWVHDMLHAARREDQWPMILPFEFDVVNRLRLVLYSSGAAVALLTDVTVMCLWPQNNTVQWIGLLLVWIVPLVVIVALAAYAARATASSPFECWPETRRVYPFLD